MTDKDPESSIGAGDDHATIMPAMRVADPAQAPTMEQIQQNTMLNSTAAFDVSQSSDRSMFGPSGHWSKGIFACFDSFFTGLFWMGCCCTPCLYGQLLQRLNLTWTGQQPAPGQKATGTCMAVFVFTSVMGCILFILRGWLANILFWAIFSWLFFMAILLRGVIRKRFGIAPTHIHACDGLLEDFIVAFCCGCCSGIQMARQTHDENRFPYSGCSNTGLSSFAPELWDNLLEQGPRAGEETDPIVSPHNATRIMPTTNGSASDDAYMSNIELV